MTEIDQIFKTKADYFDQAIRELIHYRIAAYNTESSSLKWMSDFSLFTIFGTYDLWILLCDYEKAIKKYQQIYYARQAALLLFELLEDISQHFNFHFNELFFEIVEDASIQSKAKNIRTDFNKLRNEHSSKLKVIRDDTIAHREHDITTLVDTINSIDHEFIMQLCIQFINKIEELHAIFNWTIKSITVDQIKLTKDQFSIKYKK